jgi:hypothetical protein
LTLQNTQGTNVNNATAIVVGSDNVAAGLGHMVNGHKNAVYG